MHALGRGLSISLVRVIVAAMFSVDSIAAEDVLIADFEGADYGDWRSEGEAFGSGPARGTLPGQMPVSGFEGQGLVNSFRGGDGSTGRLTSPPLKLERQHLNFLIGGGAHVGQTCMNLVIDGVVVRTATGPNSVPGGSEMLDWASWDVAEFAGRTATLEIVDTATGGWGHINIDQITQSDRPAVSDPSDRRRELKLAARYLLVPISNAAPICRMKIEIAGRVVQDFDVNLARADVDWWAVLDMDAHRGQTAAISVDRLAPGSRGLALVESSATPRHLQPLYEESLRPQLRFSQQRGWNNDPNGMVYHAGEYHLFWQSNPFGPQWANMFWGHAVSRDLVHWEELPLALSPRTMAVDKCFSGSANIDLANTGGWQQGGEPTFVVAFTDTGCGESLAISRDRGRTFEYLGSNPIIRHQGRDPKLIWYEPGQHWVIAVYSENDQRKTIDFHTSRDLKSWTLTSRLDGFFECPELVQLPIDGDRSRQQKWVIFGADAQYLVGDFNGREFTPDSPVKRRVHFGAYYASQCFSRAPGGRAIQVGWARIEMPGMPFNQAFSLPTELTLASTADGLRLRAVPVRELESLRLQPQAVHDRTVTETAPLELPMEGQLVDIELEVIPKGASAVTLSFGTNACRYDVAAGRLDEMPLPLTDGRLRCRVVVDRPMYEVVGGDGEVYKTAARSDGGKPLERVRIEVTGGPAAVRALRVYPLESIWSTSRAGTPLR